MLGLVTTKRPELEDKAAVIARIHEAAKYIPLDLSLIHILTGLPPFCKCFLSERN